MRVLAGDLGGTKALLGIATCMGDTPEFTFVRRYASADFSDVAELLKQFRADAAAALADVAGACLAVAGPLSADGRQADFTNLDWHAEADELGRLLGMPLMLANDFAAVAAGVATVPDAQCIALQAGEPLASGVRLAIGAGTGLGMAAIVPMGNTFKILPGEGGHIGFAPADSLQDDFAAFLRVREGRATAERAISGMGLVSLYRFLSGREAADSPCPLDAEDPAAAIGTLALADPASLAYRTIAVFLAAYGSFAGDMALAFMARGGVYLAGGVTQKLLPLMQKGGFMAAFNAKFEHADLACRMPVHLVADPEIGLKGAAVLARIAYAASAAGIDRSQ